MLSDSSKGEFFKETRKKILSLHGGKIEFDILCNKIQILFSSQRFFGGVILLETDTDLIIFGHLSNHFESEELTLAKREKNLKFCFLVLNCDH